MRRHGPTSNASSSASAGRASRTSPATVFFSFRVAARIIKRLRLLPLGVPFRVFAVLAGLLVAGTSETSNDPGGKPCRVDRDCNGYYRCLNQVCAVPPAVLGRSDFQTPTAEFLDGDLSRGRFLLELAVDRFQQARGLSHRPSMADGWGMLFVYSQTVNHAFTMALMRFPLDIVFIDGAGTIVDIIESAQPRAVVLVPSRAYRYVLELNAGAVRSRGLRIGDRMRLNRIPDFLPAAGG